MGSLLATKNITLDSETKKQIADLLAKGGGIHGTEMSSDMGNALEFMSAQVEVAADLLAKGAKLTPRGLSGILVQKGLSFADLSRDDYVKCAGAMASLALSVKTTALFTTTGPGVVVPAVLMVADMYMTARDCAPLAAKTHADVQDKVMNEINRYDWSDDGIRYWIMNLH